MHGTNDLPPGPKQLLHRRSTIPLRLLLIPLLLLALAVLGLFLLGVNPPVLLFGGAALALVVANRRRHPGWPAGGFVPWMLAVAAGSTGPFSLVTLT